MEAIVYNKIFSTLSYDSQRKIPDIINENDVIVNIKYSGICETDIQIIEGAFPSNEERGFVLGHEFCGIIETVGPKARFKRGQRVVIDPNSGCGVCISCHSGHYNLCEFGGFSSTIGIFQDGGWTQFCRVPDTQIFVLPDEISFELSVFCEPLSCIIHAWDKTGESLYNDNILIVGAGIIGDLWSIFLHLQGYKNVTVSELNPKRIERSRNLGLDCQYFVPEEINDLGKKFNIIIDCTGTAKALEDNLMLLKKSGKYIIFGNASPDDLAKISQREIYLRELTIIGVTSNPFTFPKAIEFLRLMGKRYINYGLLGVKEFKLTDYPQAIYQMKNGVISKAVFKL